MCLLYALASALTTITTSSSHSEISLSFYEGLNDKEATRYPISFEREDRCMYSDRNANESEEKRPAKNCSRADKIGK